MWADEVVVSASDGADDDKGETASIRGVTWGNDGSQSLEERFCVVERFVGLLGEPGLG